MGASTVRTAVARRAFRVAAGPLLLPRRVYLSTVHTHQVSGSASGRVVRLLIAAAAGMGLFVPSAGAQRNPCTTFHPMVDAVTFRGVRRVPLGDIAPIAVTERTGVFRRWFGWKVGTLTCLDSAEAVRDAEEIETAYRQRGFIRATVTAVIERHGDRHARVIFDVREGTPVAITAVAVTGLPPEAADSAAVARRLLGKAMDDSVVQAVADSLHALVRDAGYARAAPPAVQLQTDSAQLRGRVRIGFTPGALARVGSVAVRVTPSGRTPILGERGLLATFGVRAGDPFNAGRVAQGQRELGALDLFRQVRIDTVVAPGTGGARDTVHLIVSAIEGDRRRANATAGWGTLDCFRTQTRLVEQDPFGLGHRLEVNARISKIGLAQPFSGWQGLCAGRVRDDPFSQQLNYYAGATIRLRGLATLTGIAWRPEFTVFSERRSSIGAYEQTTELGALATSMTALRRGLALQLQYAYTDSRTRADRAVSCTRFGLCRLEDVTSFLLRSPQHTVAASIARDPLLPTDDRQTGRRWTVDLKYGHASIGRLLPIDFFRFTLEGASYHPLGPWLMLAVRGQLGGVIAPADRSFLLPPVERFYGGGQNSVRGYGQNLLGPGSYIVSAIDTVPAPGGTTVGVARADAQPDRIAPSGGNAMWLGNIELRTRRGWPNDLLRWVAFVDVGRVWNTRDLFNVTNAGARATPGVGVRLITPLGPFRMDIGYNPNNVDAGPAFYVTPGEPGAGVAGRAICVSPGTDDPLFLGPGQRPSAGSCPATFAPPRARSLLSRLTFHFSLGNAF